MPALTKFAREPRSEPLTSAKVVLDKRVSAEEPSLPGDFLDRSL